MRVQVSRLAALLAPMGFGLVWDEPEVFEIGFARAGKVRGTFEQVRVKGLGAGGNTVFARVAVSVVRGRNAVKGLIQDRLLTEVSPAAVKLGSDLAAQAWESRLAATVDPAARAFANENAGPLLARTEEARRDAASIAVRVEGAITLNDAKERLWRVAPEPVRAEAHRVSRTSIVQIRDADEHYLVAAALILLDRLHSHAISRDWPDDQRSEWLMQLLVDLLLERFPLSRRT